MAELAISERRIPFCTASQRHAGKWKTFSGTGTDVTEIAAPIEGKRHVIFAGACGAIAVMPGVNPLYSQLAIMSDANILLIMPFDNRGGSYRHMPIRLETNTGEAFNLQWSGEMEICGVVAYKTFANNECLLLI